MPQNTFIPVPYFQFAKNAPNFDFATVQYMPVPNKKIHRHCPFILINTDYINEPLMDVAVAVAEDVQKSASENSPDTSKNTSDVDSQDAQQTKATAASSDNAAQTAADAEETLDEEAAAREKERLDYLARQPADPRHKTSEAVEAAPTNGKPNTAKNESEQTPTTESEQEPQTSEGEEADSSNDAPENSLKPDINDTCTDDLPLPDYEETSDKSEDNDTLTDDSAEKPQESNQDDEDADTEDKYTEEEKIKYRKEKKLESYKQFIAEQKSKVDVDYQGIRVNIEANALPSRMYFIMNALSAIIASYGLVINSAAVVIGAMLVAMMLGPISGVALAIIDYRMPFLRRSLMTVLAGGAMVIVIGFIVGLLHQDTALSNEILSRTQPTSMDLMIALAGGTAGAYAMISPHLSVAVVGVAVATALVPPLAASGILFAHGQLTLGFGALLLAITNIIAIQFTNALVLWFTGFRRLMEDDYKTNTYFAFLRRNAVPLLLLAGIGGYLTYNFNAINKKQQFENSVKETINEHFMDKGNALTATQFINRDEYQTVRAVIRGETRPSPTDAQEIERAVNATIDESYPKYMPVRVQLRYMPVVVIDSSPDNEDNFDKTDAAILANE